jgi:hypothetical protein
MLRANSPLFTVYVGLLDEGVPCSRPTQAIHLGGGVYRLLPTPDYEFAEERWEFEPESIVYCEAIQNSGSEFLRAFALHPIQLRDLVGKPLSGATRAGGMAMFSFGEIRSVQTPRGPKKAAEYALHPQCAWRLCEGETVLIGSADLYYPADGREDCSNFDWDEPGANLRDVLATSLLQDDGYLIVEKAVFGRAGVLQIFLERDRCLEVFPNNSVEDEYWRLFRPGTDDLHLVVGMPVSSALE